MAQSHGIKVCFVGVTMVRRRKGDGRAPPETKQDRYPTVPQNLSRGLEDISEPYTFRGFSDLAA